MWSKFKKKKKERKQEEAANVIKSLISYSVVSLLWLRWKTSEFKLVQGSHNLSLLDFHHLSQFNRSVMSDSFRPHGLQHARPTCPSPNPRVYSNSCPWSQWCHPTISSSVVPFSSRFQSFPALRSFPMGQFFAADGQNIGASASTSVLPVNIQDWFPLGWTGWISLQSKRFSRISSNTTVQNHQFFGAQLFL